MKEKQENNDDMKRGRTEYDEKVCKEKAEKGKMESDNDK
jgi:hypothetical protein